MQDFWEHEFDVLVCTTIIESGLDMPTVNTLVVDRSDLLGLAQLYQLRGRVGRRGQRAYAYLFHPADRVLTEEAYERLKTIGEFTDLGSGFKIAMRDLEIRGAGNLLGAAQSGHIAAVGFDLYCQMVTEAVGELKGEPIPEPLEITVDVPVDASLPRDYVARDDVRMEAYRRLAAVTDPVDVDDVRAEWEDRYGPPPAAAVALLDVARLRAECVRLGIRSIIVQRDIARITGLELRESQKVRLRRLAPKAVAKDDNEIAIPLSVKPADVAPMLVDAARRPRAAAADPAVGSARASLRSAMSRSTLAAILAVVIVGRGDRRRDRRLQRHRRVARGACRSTTTRCRRATLNCELGGFADSSFFASRTSEPQPPVGFKVVRRRGQLARGRGQLARATGSRRCWRSGPRPRRVSPAQARRRSTLRAAGAQTECPRRRPTRRATRSSRLQATLSKLGTSPDRRRLPRGRAQAARNAHVTIDERYGEWSAEARCVPSYRLRTRRSRRPPASSRSVAGLTVVGPRSRRGQLRPARGRDAALGVGVGALRADPPASGRRRARGAPA